MASKSNTLRIRILQGTAAQFMSANPILAAGEPSYTTDTRQLRIGDGVTNWMDLPTIVSDTDLTQAVADSQAASAAAIAAANSATTAATDAQDTADDVAAQFATIEAAVTANTSGRTSIRPISTGGTGAGTPAAALTALAAGDANVGGSVRFNDESRLHFGDNEEYSLYYDATEDDFILQMPNETSGLRLIDGMGQQIARFFANGGVLLNYQETLVFQTVDGGVSMLEDLTVTGRTVLEDELDVAGSMDVAGSIQEGGTALVHRKILVNEDILSDDGPAYTTGSQNNVQFKEYLIPESVANSELFAEFHVYAHPNGGDNGDAGQENLIYCADANGDLLVDGVQPLSQQSIMLKTSGDGSDSIAMYGMQTLCLPKLPQSAKIDLSLVGGTGMGWRLICEHSERYNCTARSGLLRLHFRELIDVN